MAQDCVADAGGMSNNMLEVHVGNGYMHDRDDKQPSFSNDTLLSSVQSTEFSPRSDVDSVSTGVSSSATKNALDPPPSDGTFLIATAADSEGYQDIGSETSNGRGADDSLHSNGNNGVMTTSATSSTMSTSAIQHNSRFNTFSSPSRRLDSFSSSSTTRSKAPGSASKTPNKDLFSSDDQNNGANGSDHEMTSPQKLEDRLNAVKAARERQEAERARRLAELAEALRLQQSSYEQRRAEMRRAMEERRVREEEHRRAVEERRRRLFEAEQAKREAILRKLEEREVKIRETRIRSAQFMATGADGVIIGGVSNAKLSGSVFCVTAQSASTAAIGRSLADGHRAYSIASLRRGDGVRSASCDRHGAVVSGERTANNLLDNSVVLGGGGGLQKSPASHRQSSTALSRSPGGPSTVAPGIMSVSMICLSPSEKATSSMNQAPQQHQSTAVGSTRTATSSGATGASTGTSTRRSRKQQAESASTASLHQIGDQSSSFLTAQTLPTNARMCASLVNIPEEEPLTSSLGHRRFVNGKQRLLASRASLLTWQQTTLSRRAVTPAGQRQSVQVTTSSSSTSMYSRYQPRPSSVPARPRVRRDAPTMFIGAADAPVSPVPSARGAPSAAPNGRRTSNNGGRTVAAASVRMSISFHEELSSVLANGGASEMTLTASVTAAIVPPSSTASSRTSSLRAKSERHLNRLSVAPVGATNGSDAMHHSITNGASKKASAASASSRQSLAPSKQPSTPSTARAHPPTKPALLPSTPSATRSSMAPSAPSSNTNGSAVSDRVETSLDCDAEREYQRKIAEKRRQAREAAAAKAQAAVIAAEKSAAAAAAAASPSADAPLNSTTETAEAPNDVSDGSKMELTVVSSSVMARSAPPDIIASALDGDGSVSSTTRSTNDSPQPLPQSPTSKSSLSPESAISEPPSEKLAAEAEDTTVSSSSSTERATNSSSVETIVVVPPVINVTMPDEKTVVDSQQQQQEKALNGVSSSASDSSSQPSSAAVSPPVSSAATSEGEQSSSTTAATTKQDSPRITRPMSQDLSSSQRLQQDVAAVRERLSSLTGSQSSLLTASTTSLSGSAKPQTQAADDWAKKQEEERAERKKRLDAIMSRVKPSAAPTASSATTPTTATPQLNPTGSSQSMAPAHPHLTGPIQSMPVLPSTTTPNVPPSSSDSAALTELSVGVNGSSSSYVVPSADILLSKIKSEKVQSILANRLASSGSKVRFNLGKEDSKEDNNGVGSVVPDLQSSSSPLPRLQSSSVSQPPPVTAALLMLSSSSASASSSADDHNGHQASVPSSSSSSSSPVNGASNGHHHSHDDGDRDDDEDSNNEDRKLDEVILLGADDGQSTKPQPPPSASSVEAFVN